MKNVVRGSGFGFREEKKIFFSYRNPKPETRNPIYEPQTPNPEPRNSGFTFVELVVIIVVMGLVSLALLIPIRMTLQGNVNIDRLTKAVDLAEERMDMILVRRHSSGFSGTTDPCGGPSICTPPAGYTVSSSIADNWQGNTNYKEITITVSGEGDAVIKTLVGNY